jgi:hypothetical protein
MAGRGIIMNSIWVELRPALHHGFVRRRLAFQDRDRGEQKMRTVLFVLLVATAVAGCASVDRNGLIAAGYSPQYVDGYEDGYSTGCHTVGHPFCQFTRDVVRFERDRQYKLGWEDGFSIGRTDYAALW